MRHAIKAELRWNPELSDYAIARKVGCHNVTVAVVRRGGTWTQRKKGKSYWLNRWRDGAPEA
jgi:hypothetical protein